MPLFFKKNGAYVPASLWFKAGGVWKTVDRQNPQNFKVWFKTGGAWQEVWPKLPNPATSLSIAQDYGVTAADRISWNFSWTAPVGGTAVTNYIVDVFTVDAYGNPATALGTYNTGTTTSLSLQNQGGYAGQVISFAVTTQSAYGTGPTVRGPNFAGAQYPSPPSPIVSGVSLASGSLSFNYVTPTGNRVSGAYVIVSDDYGRSAIAGLALGTGARFDVMSWDPNALDFNGFNFTVTVYVYGPGGTSSSSASGQRPADPSISGVRFRSGTIQGDYTLGNYANFVNFVTRDAFSGATNSLNASGTAGVHSFNIGGTYLDGHRYSVTAYSANGTGSGPDVRVDSPAGGFFRKLSNPFYVNAVDSITYQGNTITGGAPYTFYDPNYIFQGFGSGLMDHGYVYYGNAFANSYSAAAVGYSFLATQADILIGRGPDGNPGYVPPVIHPHVAQSVSDGFVSLLGDTYAQSGMLQGTAAWLGFPAFWVQYFINQTNGWRGLGFYDPNTTVNPSTGVTDSWFRFYRETNSAGGTPYFTVRVYHDA